MCDIRVLFHKRSLSDAQGETHLCTHIQIFAHTGATCRGFCPDLSFKYYITVNYFLPLLQKVQLKITEHSGNQISSLSL